MHLLGEYDSSYTQAGVAASRAAPVLFAHREVMCFSALVFIFLLFPLPLVCGSVCFTDIAEQTGIFFPRISGNPDKKDFIIESKGGGLALFDADGDGWLDIYLVNGGYLKAPENRSKPRNRLFRNNQDGTFEDVTEESGTGDDLWGIGCACADIENDGDMDLYVTNYGANRLYINDGSCRFKERACEFGCNDGRWSTGAALGDYDRDGWVDLIVTNFLDLEFALNLPPGDRYTQWRGFPVLKGPRGLPPQADSLFRNRGDGTFEDVTARAGLDDLPARYGLTPQWADVNEDGWPDLYVANDSGPSYLYINNQDGTFTEEGILASVAYDENGSPMASMGAAFGDVDCDGHLDLAVTNFSEEYFCLYMGEGNGEFRDESFMRGIAAETIRCLGWGVHLIDVDNDGDEDLFSSNGHVYPIAAHPDVNTSYAMKNLLFENDGTGHFRNITPEAGPGLGVERVSRGSAMGDLDNDGDLDIVVVNLAENVTILRNDTANENHWLQVTCVGDQSNRGAVGAIVRLRAGDRQQMRLVSGSGSFLSHNDIRAHFGLGGASTVTELRVLWPSGGESVFHDIEADRHVHVEESGKLSVVR